MEISIHWGKSPSPGKTDSSNWSVKCVLFNQGGKAAICSNAAHLFCFLNNTYRADFYGNRAVLILLGGTA